MLTGKKLLRFYDELRISAHALKRFRQRMHLEQRGVDWSELHSIFEQAVSLSLEDTINLGFHERKPKGLDTWYFLATVLNRKVIMVIVSGLKFKQPQKKRLDMVTVYVQGEIPWMYPKEMESNPRLDPPEPKELGLLPKELHIANRILGKLKYELKLTDKIIWKEVSQATRLRNSDLRKLNLGRSSFGRKNLWFRIIDDRPVVLEVKEQDKCLTIVEAYIIRT